MTRRDAVRIVAALAGLLAAAGCLAQPVAWIHVTDQAGQPSPARVLITREGTDKPDLYVVFADAQGDCPLTDVPPGQASIEVSRGPEWSVETVEAVIHPLRGETQTVTLRRLCDLPARGYYGGDSHMHSTFSDGAQKPEDVARHCRAEGLEWAFLTDHNSVAGHEAFKAQATADFLPMGGQEVTTGRGHIPALGISTLVSPDVTQGAADVERIFRQVHEQGGIAVIAHPQVPVMSFRDWDVPGYDAIEILNGSLAPYGPVFDTLQARLRWHEFLNQGRHLAAIGSSDNHDNAEGIVREALRDPEAAMQREPLLRLLWAIPNREQVLMPWARKGLFLGIYRTYVKTEGLRQEAILEGLRAGRGFVTNGPIIVATVNDQDPGSDITGPTAHVSYEVVGNRGLTRLDVVVGGKVAQSVPLQGQEARGEVEVPVGEAHWLVLECYGPWPEFATTNAWYVTGAP